MRPSGLIYFFLAATCWVAACRRSEQPQVSTAAPTIFNKIELGNLVTKEEVGRIQKTAITDLKQSEIVNGDFITSQGYYASTEPNCSVSIAVMQRNPDKPNGRTTEQSWKESFANAASTTGPERGEKESEQHTEDKEEESEHGAPAASVEGVGEEAFWTTNAVGGIFYALQNHMIVRVSVGGPSSMEEKKERSKALASKAISHLPR